MLWWCPALLHYHPIALEWQLLVHVNAYEHSQTLQMVWVCLPFPTADASDVCSVRDNGRHLNKVAGWCRRRNGVGIIVFWGEQTWALVPRGHIDCSRELVKIDHTGGLFHVSWLLGRSSVCSSQFVATLGPLVAMLASEFGLVWYKYQHFLIALKPLVSELLRTSVSLNKSVLAGWYSVDNGIPWYMCPRCPGFLLWYLLHLPP